MCITTNHPSSLLPSFVLFIFLLFFLGLGHYLLSIFYAIQCSKVIRHICRYDSLFVIDEIDLALLA